MTFTALGTVLRNSGQLKTNQIIHIASHFCTAFTWNTFRKNTQALLPLGLKTMNTVVFLLSTFTLTERHMLSKQGHLFMNFQVIFHLLLTCLVHVNSFYTSCWVILTGLWCRYDCFYGTCFYAAPATWKNMQNNLKLTLFFIIGHFKFSSCF